MQEGSRRHRIQLLRKVAVEEDGADGYLREEPIAPVSALSVRKILFPRVGVEFGMQQKIMFPVIAEVSSFQALRLMHDGEFSQDPVEYCTVYYWKS